MSMTIKAAQVALPRWALALLLALMTLLAACSDSPPAQPTISVQPTDTSAVAGTAAILSVSASGPDIGYQWQLSTDAGTTFANITGATSASYTTPVTSSGDNGKRYRVVVTAAGISVNSSAVTLTVTAAVVAPGITVAPPSASVIAPAAAVFNVTATGTAVSYQWQRSTDNGGSWSNVSGATAASFDSGASDATMNGTRYRVIVSNSAGSVTSAVATLTVSAAPAAPAFGTQATNQSVAAGSAAAFSVVATGTPTPTLQWQRSSDGGTTFANIAGATDPTYNTGLTTLSQDGERYRVTASNSSGSTTSNAVRLTVNPAPQAPVITTQPAAQNVTAPASASFIVTASGVPTPTWQWQLSSDSGGTWANINGATLATYTTPPTVVGDSGKRYRAVATNSSGSATSASAILTAAAPPATAQWGTATALQNIGAAGQVKVAAGANGEFVVVWIETAGTWSLRSQRFVPATGWAPVTTINTSGATPAGDFDVAMNPAGSTATVVWVDNFQVSMWVSQSGSDGAWSTTQALPAGGNYAGNNFPRVAMDSSGAATAGWLQNNNPSPGVYVRTIVATRYGGPTQPTWGAPVVISAPTDNPNGFLVLKSNANGDLVAAWVGNNNALSSGSTSQQTIANVYRPATGWDGPTALTDSATAAQGYLTGVAINESGVAAVAYNFTSTTAGSVQRGKISRYTAGTWGLRTDPATASTTTLTASVRIALDAAGLLSAAWSQPGFTAWAAHETAPGTWDSTAQLSANGELKDVVVDSNGNALAVWIEVGSDGFLSRLKSARLLAGANVWTSLSGLTGASANPAAFSAEIAVSSNGDIVAAWYDRVTSKPWGNVLR